MKHKISFKIWIYGENYIPKTFSALKNVCDPSNPQFEPELAWLENLRRIYEETDDDSLRGGEND